MPVASRIRRPECKEGSLSPEKIPENIRRIFQDHIDSVEQLHVLVLLQDNGERAWTVQSISQELRSTPGSVEKRLRDLISRRLLAADSIGPEGSVRYLPYNEESAQNLRDITAFYKQRQYTAIDLIFSKSTSAMQSFADAFRFKKEEEE
jgi:hypothetical protein